MKLLLREVTNQGLKASIDAYLDGLATPEQIQMIKVYLINWSLMSGITHQLAYEAMTIETAEDLEAWLVSIQLTGIEVI